MGFGTGGESESESEPEVALIAMVVRSSFLTGSFSGSGRAADMMRWMAW